MVARLLRLNADISLWSVLSILVNFYYQNEANTAILRDFCSCYCHFHQLYSLTSSARGNMASISMVLTEVLAGNGDITDALMLHFIATTNPGGKHDRRH